MTRRRPLAALAAAALLVVAPAAPALAARPGPVPAVVPAATVPAATVTVDAPDGVAADGPTTVQVSGTGFQVVPGGFGGVYVLFGWVDDPDGGSWRPSAGGATGTTLRYAVDDAARENAGHQVFVAFPGASTAVEANGGQLAEDGSWSATLTVPGARFTALDAAGAPVDVDCATTTCGVITIGAHGVANATNETFTPVDLVAPGTAPVDAGAPAPTPSAATSSASTAVPADAASTAPTPAPDAAGSTDAASALPVVVATAGVVVAAAAAAVVVALRRRRSGDA